MGFTRDQRKAMLASGMRPEELERAEAGMCVDETHNYRLLEVLTLIQIP